MKKSLKKSLPINREKAKVIETKTEDYFNYLAKLLLPIKDERLLQHILQEEIELAKKDAVEALAKKNIYCEHLAVINVHGGFDAVASELLTHAEADEHFTAVFTFENGIEKKYMIHQRIGENELLLNHCGLVRIHRSYLVNLKMVKHFDTKELFLILKSDKKLPISEQYAGIVNAYFWQD